jgi:hypothetical protein
VNGLRLEEMELSDMLDVVHYFYEEDLNYASVEQAQMTDARRITLFKQLYGIDYKYASSDAKNKIAGNPNFDYDFDDLAPFDPTNVETKPFVPATDMDEYSSTPFGAILDAPIN